ncbi:geranylgeranylglyceryl/heptaprenylglyceryl phosphate synthase [Belliella pelovolcani]|uniref:Geranylgeranylglyceryl phosphate synthase n=1 Tax=Belliella pelovolcani TaxID=529505 RepID=A0A1N7KKJ0_9BACT|nr:geranylgeranylglyceryl/heptaprenylglyceryl phosphate synthase [Belliella pelovolcani]SIS62105.1 putative glycerol-1-phosphate prenyltransferase [Belliella pelovolcani]
MKHSAVTDKILSNYREGRKAIAWLIDPDKLADKADFLAQLKIVQRHHLDFIFIGGSLVESNGTEEIIATIKQIDTTIPVILFPGNASQFTPNADAILFLSLISGRNPEFLIGQHVTVAPLLAKSKMEVLPTGYMLVDGGVTTSVNYISQTIPLPNNKPEIALATALAGSFLGLKYFYLDAGSGAQVPVSSSIIQAIKSQIDAPLIVGGGLNTLDKVKSSFKAGADVVVIGNGAEKNLSLLTEVLEYVHVLNLSLNIN